MPKTKSDDLEALTEELENEVEEMELDEESELDEEGMIGPDDDEDELDKDVPAEEEELEEEVVEEGRVEEISPGTFVHHEPVKRKRGRPRKNPLPVKEENSLEEDSSTGPNNGTGEGELLDIPLSKLVYGLSDRSQVELKESDPGIILLAENIKAIGQITPIVVRAKDAGTYEVLAGKRRLAAARRLSMKTIKAFVTPNFEGTKAKLGIISDNFFRTFPAKDVKGRICKELLESKAFKSQQQLAVAFGVAQSTIANWIADAEAVELLQKKGEKVGSEEGKPLPGYVGRDISKAKRKAKKEGKELTAETIAKTQAERKARQFQKISPSLLFDDEGARDVHRFQVAYSGEEIRLVFTFPLKELDQGIQKLLKAELQEVNSDALKKSIAKQKKTLAAKA